MAKIMEIISKETGGKSYNTEKYSYDTIGMPSFDYDDDGEKFIKWQVSGETEKHKTYVDLTNEAKRQIGKRPVISYFLDGSRHTYKVDDISYNKKVYPVYRRTSWYWMLQTYRWKNATRKILQTIGFVTSNG